MKIPTKAVGVENINACKPAIIFPVRLVICLVVLLSDEDFAILFLAWTLLVLQPPLTALMIRLALV